MQTTRHFQQRMSQRGVSRDMVDFVMDYGMSEQDKYVLGRKEALNLLEKIQRQQRLLKKILDKGGIVVVADENVLITTYNYKRRSH